MQRGADAYYKTATVTMTPRDLEASLLLKAARQLQDVHDRWTGMTGEADSALGYNRKLWTILIGAVTDDASQLPKPIRQNVANIGLFILKRTVEMMADPRPEKLNALISLNRELAAGLRAKPEQPAA